MKTAKSFYLITIVTDFQAPSFDPDEGPNIKESQRVKEKDDDDDEDDESYPLLKETDLGGTPGTNAFNRQCR